MIYLQFQQFINLFILLLLGKYVMHFYLPWEYIVSILLFTAVVEHTYLVIKNKKLTFFSFSSLSTALGVMLMMVTTQLSIYFVLIGLALLQKHFLTVNGRHFFNPSNFSLMIGLLFFYEDAHMVLGQLGDVLWLKIVVGVLAFMILVRVERWVIPLTFSMMYLISQYFFVVSYDPVMILEEVMYRFYSVSFIVFIVFMLTDPKTTPKGYGGQILFSVILALIATVLDRIYGFRIQHLFMALFILSPLVVIFSIWQEKKEHKKWLIWGFVFIVLSLSAIIYIETKPPYYFEMDG